MNSAVALPAVQKDEIRPLRPMGWIESLLLFGIPAAALAFSVLWLWPVLVDAGLSRPAGYALALGWVNLGLLAAAVAGYLVEGNPRTWPAFCQRMRLAPMTGRIWLWTIASTVLFAILGLLIEALVPVIFKAIHFTMPATVGVALGLWLNLITLLLNIFGEELWWRGYILPRQELAFGRFTWLFHGCMWAFFHIYKWWAVPFMLITCQIIPFVAQRTKNTWPGIINHLLINGASAILTALS